MKQAYVTKVSDMLEKKYCHILGDISNHIKDLKEDDSMYIMPKQLVKCPKQASSRYRLCLDGSQLHTMTSRGPNLINELYNLLIRFRAKPVALTGDIQEAFFQIRVRQSDQKLLNFLYRDPDKDSSEEIQLIRFNVLTMGIPSASFELASCLRKIAELEKDENPEIADAILRSVYADDLISSHYSEEEAIIFTKNIVTVLAKYGFLLHKFSSESEKVMNAIPPELRDITSEISIADPALLELATKSDTSPRNLAKCLGYI